MAITLQRWSGTEWIDETAGSGGGGSSNHAGLTNLAWLNSKHEGTASKLAGFDSAGEVAEYDLEAYRIGVAASDETTDLTTGTAKLTFRMPEAMTVSEVRMSVTTAPVGSTIEVDINMTGVSILSTVLTIDASEKTSTTAATPAVISTTALTDDAEMTIDIDQVGSGTAGAGLKVWLIGVRA